MEEVESLEQQLSSRQAALDAVLADWSSTSDLAGQVVHILDDDDSNGLLHRVGLPAINDQNDLWSVIGATTGLDKVITLSGDMA
jgi:hypothetical protein